MERTGGCACGAIRFKLTAPIIGTGACHCTDCQKLAGGGPNYVALVSQEGLEITKGEPKLHRSKGDTGEEVARAFCPDCGTPLWSYPPSGKFHPVKLGALDDSSDLSVDMHIYVSSAPAWHIIPEGVPTFPKMPPMPGE